MTERVITIPGRPPIPYTFRSENRLPILPESSYRGGEKVGLVLPDDGIIRVSGSIKNWRGGPGITHFLATEPAAIVVTNSEGLDHYHAQTGFLGNLVQAYINISARKINPQYLPTIIDVLENRLRWYVDLEVQGFMIRIRGNQYQ